MTYAPIGMHKHGKGHSDTTKMIQSSALQIALLFLDDISNGLARGCAVEIATLCGQFG